MAARTKRTGPLSQEWRNRIKTGVLLDRLEKHVVGKLELTATQVQAARILLGKTIPDMKAVEHSAGDGTTIAPAVLIVSAKQGV